jgi:predicted metalloprotease with PDZ domain
MLGQYIDNAILLQHPNDVLAQPLECYYFNVWGYIYKIDVTIRAFFSTYIYGMLIWLVMDTCFDHEYSNQVYLHEAKHNISLGVDL